MCAEEIFHYVFMEELTLQKSHAELTRGKQCSLLKDTQPLTSFFKIQRQAKCNFVSYLT